MITLRSDHSADRTGCSQTSVPQFVESTQILGSLPWLGVDASAAEAGSSHPKTLQTTDIENRRTPPSVQVDE